MLLLYHLFLISSSIHYTFMANSYCIPWTWTWFVTNKKLLAVDKRKRRGRKSYSLHTSPKAAI